MPGPARKDEISAAFNETFDRINTGIRQAVDGFTLCVQRVEEKTPLLGPLLPYVREQLGRVREALQKLIKLIQYAVEHHLPVLSLIIQSFDWITNVQVPMSNLSGPATDPRDENLRHWTGAAADAYWAKADIQQGAIDDVTVKAGFISEWLFTIAQANVDYALTLADTAAEFAGTIANAAVEAGTVVGIVFSIQDLANAVGQLVEGALKRLAASGERFMDALGNVRDIASEVGDHTKLPNGRWPEAVAG